MIVALFYLNKSTSIGRGVFALSVVIVYFSILIHHVFLLRSLRN